MDNEKDLEVKEALPDYERCYTFEEWLTLESDQWIELYDGKLIYISTPLVKHQAILGNLYLQFGNFLKGKKCNVYLPPLGVRIFENEDTVLIPDLLVICDKEKLDERVCNGAPDLTIEILSPSTAKRDKLVKYRLYQKAGVREYWIIDPDTDTLQVGVLSAGSYITSVYGSTDKAPVHILENFEIDLSEVFVE